MKMKTGTGREEGGSHAEDISINVIFIILQQPLEKRQPLAYVGQTALMTTTGETLKNGH